MLVIVVVWPPGSVDIMVVVVAGTVDVIVVAAAVVVETDTEVVVDVTVVVAVVTVAPGACADNPSATTVPGVAGVIALAPVPTIVNISCLPSESCPVVTPTLISDPRLISLRTVPVFLSKNLM